MTQDAERLPPISFPQNLFAGSLAGFPVTSELVELLGSEEEPAALAGLRSKVSLGIARGFEEEDEEALQDLHRALFAIYEVSMANPLSRACVHEHAPWLVAIRGQLEAAWLESDLEALDLPPADRCASMTLEEVEQWFVSESERCSAVDEAVVGHLEQTASIDEFRTFLAADAYLNYRFFDALVLSMIHYLESVKTEISTHFWEEAGEGDVGMSHTRQFTRSLEALGLSWSANVEWDDWRPYSGHNLYFCFGLSRQHYFKALGSLAMPELFDVSRDQAVVNGLDRLGLEPEKQFEYYWNHVEADAEHGPGWLNGVILPVAAAQPEAIQEMMAGAALRMLGMRRFNEYLASLFRTPNLAV